MKVKVGDNIFDSNDQPIMVVLSDFDKQNIQKMAPEATMYASFPCGYGTYDQMLAWMDIEKPEFMSYERRSCTDE